MPATHGTLIGFIALEETAPYEQATRFDRMPNEDATIWETFARLGVADSTWNEWDTPPGRPPSNVPQLNGPRFRAAAASLASVSRFTLSSQEFNLSSQEFNLSSQEEPLPIPTCLEADRGLLLEELSELASDLAERISRA